MFESVFEALKAIMEPCRTALTCTADTEDTFHLYTDHIMKNGKPLWFGGVEIKKNYVSYHLMPIYVDPGLLEGISPKLKKRMQGKSCFNFKKVDEELFEELKALTMAGVEDYRAKGYI